VASSPLTNKDIADTNLCIPVPLIAPKETHNLLNSITDTLLAGMTWDVFVPCQPFCRVLRFLSSTRK
jgi:hypothetical protein